MATQRPMPDSTTAIPSATPPAASPPVSVPPSVSPKRSVFFRITSLIDTKMRTVFFRLGFFVAGNPFKTIIAAILLMGLCLIGMLRFRPESREENLWIPQGTIALQNKAYVDANFGRSTRSATIAFVKRGTNRLVTKPAFLEMLDVAEAGWNVTADPIEEEGADNTLTTFPERCETTTDTAGNEVCFFFSIFALFYKTQNVDVEQGQLVDFFATVRRGITEATDTDIRNTLQNPPQLNYDGSPLIAGDLISGRTGSGDNFDVNIVLHYHFIEFRSIVEDGSEIDKEGDALEEIWTDTLLETTPLLKDRTVDWYVQSQFSQSDSLEQALTGDLPLLSIGFALLGVYVILFLGDFHSVRSHMWLALGALATTGLALGACFGFSSAVGMFFGPVHQILPLLIIGIGIDDCFHITRAFDEYNRRPDSIEKTLRNRVALALSQAGSAITVTSFTNVIVFLLSGISRLPALRFFALWAAVGIFFAWLFAVTFFTALVSLDARRQDAKRRDCCPCFKVQEVKPLNWFKRPPGGFSRFFGNQFGPFIMRPVIRAILLLLFTAGFAACCYGTSQLYLKFEFSLFYPDGSAQNEFQTRIDKYFQLGDPTNVYVQSRDLSTVENQRRLSTLCQPDSGLIANNEWIESDSVDCWYSSMRSELGLSDTETIPPDQFIGRVQDFLAPDTPGSRYAFDVVFNEDKTEVVGSRFSAQYVYRETNDDEIVALKSVRADCDSVGFGDEGDIPAAYPYSFFDTFTEQYDALPREIGLSLGLSIVAVAIVCLVLIGHPVVAAVSLLVVGIIIIDVLGLTFFSDIQLNSVSVITLVLCTGISVDFVIHITRAFLEHVGTRTERAIKSLEVMGPPVFYAGFSTFLAIIVLSIAKSYIFRVLFRGFLFLILMGFIHGLILGPIILSLIGPGSFYVDEDDKARAERALEERVISPEAKQVGSDDSPTERIEGGSDSV